MTAKIIPWVLLTFVALLAYANALPNVLVMDDRLFAATAIWQQESDLVRLFTENVWAAAGASENLYRPLFLVSVSLDARFFGENYAAWHGLNVGLHILVTLLVFVLVRMLLERFYGEAGTASFLAFLAALIFAVHPVHTEVVNSIFNRSEMLASIGVLAGAVWLLKFIDSKTFIAWTGAIFAYLFGLFSRETAVVMPGILAILVWCWTTGSARRRVLKSLPVLLMLVPMLIYFKAREYAIEGPVQEIAAAGSPAQPSAQLIRTDNLFNVNRLLAVAGIWLQAMKMMVWPIPLKLAHGNVDISLRVIGLILHLGLVIASVWLASKRKFGLLIGLTVFYLGLLPSSRLFGSFESPHLTERYLYLPSVGFCLIIAFALRHLLVRTDKKLTAAPIILAVMLMMPIGWARNELWSNDLVLAENDYRAGVTDANFLRHLTGLQLVHKEYESVVEICEKYSSRAQLSGMFHSHCGTAYRAVGEEEKAVAAYMKATKSRWSAARAHSNLAGYYLSKNQREMASFHYQEAIRTERDDAMRLYRQGNFLLNIYPNSPQRVKEAIEFYDKALTVQPRLALASKRKARAERRLAQLGAN